MHSDRFARYAVQYLRGAHMLRVQDLSPETRAKIDGYVLDYADQEHQHLSWHNLLPYASLMRLRGYLILLPISEDQHAFITAERIFFEVRQAEFVLLLNYEPMENTGRRIFALCQWLPQETFYMTTIFHYVLRDLCSSRSC